MRLCGFLALALLLGSPSGCKKKDGADDKGPAAMTGPVAAPAIPPPPPAPPAQTVVVGDGGASEAILDPSKAGDWIARSVTPALEQESKTRPAGALKAEDVLAAVEKAGVKLAGRNQALGAIVGAAYCLSADTEKMVGLLVCEYVDDAAAQKGGQLTKQLYNLAMPMDVIVRGKTAVAITNLTKSAETDAEAKKITDAFGAM